MTLFYKVHCKVVHCAHPHYPQDHVGVQGGTCVKGSISGGGTSGAGVFLWVLCSMLFTLTVGGALLWLQQAGYLTWDNIRNRFSRSHGALDEGLYHELSMDTGF